MLQEERQPAGPVLVSEDFFPLIRKTFFCPGKAKLEVCTSRITVFLLSQLTEPTAVADVWLVQDGQWGRSGFETVREGPEQQQMCGVFQ